MEPRSSESSTAGSPARVGLAVFAGALLVGIYDLGLAAWQPVSSGQSTLEIARFAPLLILAVPTALAATAALLAWLARRLRARFGPRRWIDSAVDAFASSPLLALLPDLFTGPAIRSSSWRWPALFLTLLAALAAAGLLRRAAVHLARRLRRSARARIRSAAVGIGAMILGIALPHAVTARVLPGLYESFHQALALIAIGISAAGFFVLLTVHAPRLPNRRALLTALLVGAACWPLGALATRSAPIGRQLLAEHAPFAGSFARPLFDLSRLFTAGSDSAGQPDPLRSAGLSAARFPDDANRRDVLVVTVDALRGDALDPDGSPGPPAPGLRRLALSARRYTRAYSPSNYTPYSIPGLMLGFVPPDAVQPSADETVAEAFGRGGYRTELFFTAHEYASLEHTPVWPLVSRGFHFQYYHPEYEGVDRVLDRVERLLGTGDEPLFLWAHLSDVHAPYLLRRERDSRARAFTASYAGQLAYLDSVLAPRLSSIVARHPQLVWALSSDHGESLGERGRRFHGSSLFDEQVRVPLVIGGPGVEPGAVHVPVGNGALPATLLELAGASLPATARSLPLAEREPERVPPVLIVGRRERCAIVEGDLKLIASPADGIAALYDLAHDPAERTNLVRERAATAARLLAALPELGCPFELGDLEIGSD